MDDDDQISSLSLFLADTLEDLNIDNLEDAAEIVESVGSSDNNNDGGLKIANALLQELKSHGRPNLETVKKWDDVFGMTSNDGEVPIPWITKEDMSKKGGSCCKLEILLVLATTLQQRRLERKKQRAAPAPAPAPATTSTTNSDRSFHKYASPQNYYKDLDEEQIRVLNDCYSILKSDYEQRGRGMRQRFQILKSNFGVDLPANSATTKTNNNEKEVLSSESELLNHFALPHSLDLQLQKEVIAQRKKTANTASTASDNVTITDRGGRLEAESRITLPEWTSK